MFESNCTSAVAVSVAIIFGSRSVISAENVVSTTVSPADVLTRNAVLSASRRMSPTSIESALISSTVVDSLSVLPY